MDARYFDLGPRLTLTFALLITLILGGNGLLVWQFHIARLQEDRLAGVSRQMTSVLRLQGTLLSFHQRLGELAESRNAYVLRTESDSLQSTLLEQIQQTRGFLTLLPSGTHVDPLFLPTLEAIEISLPAQLRTITALASSGDWEAVQFRVADRLKPIEIQASALVKIVDQEFARELSRSEANMRTVQDRILVLVPAMAISTFSIATFFAWAIARRIIKLRLEERLNERTRLTRELHDTFLQTIQGSKLVADDALDPSADPIRMRRAMEKLSLWLGKATQEGRAALNSLRATTTQTNDLADALRRVTEDGLIPGSMAVTFSVVGDAREMHPIVRDEIYRVGYEAIHNACTHSGASQLEVELRYAHDLALRVTDNGTGVETLRYSASILPYAQVDLMFRSSGYVTNVSQVRGADGRTRDIGTGDYVQQGLTLAHIRLQDLQNQVAQAQAQVDQATAQHSKADQDLQRAKALYSTQSLTRPDYDQAQEAFSATQAAMDNAKAALLQAQLMLGDADLKAPFSGYVLSRNIDLGSLVSPASSAFTIADIGRVKATFGAPDYVLSQIRLGQELTLQTENDAVPLKGRITSISPSADTRNRIFAIEVTVNNRDRHLKPGMIATISLGEVPHSSISVPLSAIVPFPSEPEHFAVMVAQQRAGTLIATLRKIQLGATQDNSVAVEGVQPGERVVSVGAQLLRDGDSIHVIP